jgi:predicted RNase H-like HicB family nuclease
MSGFPKKKHWTFFRRKMKVRVIYRSEPEGVWAESPDAPGYSAVGATLDEVRQLVAEGLPVFLGKKVEVIESGASMVDDLLAVTNFGSDKPFERSFGPPPTGTKPKLAATS